MTACVGLRRRQSVPALVVLVWGMAHAATPTLAGAQRAGVSGHVLAGEVRSLETGAPIAGARVTLAEDDAEATNAMTQVTSETGEFRFAGIGRGAVRLVVRRLAFYPETLTVSFPREGTLPLVVPLALQIPILNTVVVRGTMRLFSGPMAEFNRRRSLGFGHFITREQIERRRATRTTDLLRMVPGLAFDRGESGITRIRIRGTNCGDPNVWLDGSPLGAAELFDLDAISPQSIEGLEIYSGIATLPAELRGPRTSGRCGGLVVWTRRGENRRRRDPAVSAEKLAEQVNASHLYTADHVDRPASLQRDLASLVAYPEALLEQRTSGQVVLEFVVDTTGHVEIETVSVVATSDLALSDAVRAVLPQAAYVVAMRAGRPVRQLVQLPMHFAVHDPPPRQP